MDEGQEAASFRTDVQNSERRSSSYGKDKIICSKESQSHEEKGHQQRSFEGRQKMASFQTQGGSQRRQAIYRQSKVAKEIRHKRQRSPDGSPDRRHQSREEREVKARKTNNSESSRACRYSRNSSADSGQRPQDKRAKPTYTKRHTGRGRPEESQKAGGHSAKYYPHLSSEAGDSVPRLLSGLFTNMGAITEILGELCAPGGAFLPVPSNATQPAVQQRSWLTWQLSHAGAALHWAVATLDATLASQLCPPAGHSHLLPYASGSPHQPQGFTFSKDSHPSALETKWTVRLQTHTARIRGVVLLSYWRCTCPTNTAAEMSSPSSSKSSAQCNWFLFAGKNH